MVANTTTAKSTSLCTKQSASLALLTLSMVLSGTQAATAANRFGTLGSIKPKIEL